MQALKLTLIAKLAVCDDADIVDDAVDLTEDMPQRSGRERISSRISCIPDGSRPFVGSSRISSFGKPSIAEAMPKRCFMPRE